MPDATCAGFSADTEVLTRAGWKPVTQATEDDEIATRSPDGLFLWRKPERVCRVTHDGPMAWMHGRSVDLLVARATTLLVSQRRRIRKVAELAPSDRLCAAMSVGATPRLVATSTWRAPDVAELVLPGIRAASHGPRPRDFAMTGDHYAAFMGAYIAEGCAGNSGSGWFVDVSQMESGKGYAEYLELLTAILRRRPGRGGHAWRIYSRSLYEHCHPLGLATAKRLPAVLLDMSARQLALFWRYYFLGDGSAEVQAGRRPHEVAATGSPVLAGQIQEVAQKLGSAASVRRYALRPNSRVKAQGFIYKVRFRFTAAPECTRTIVPYRGTLTAFSPAERPVFVRRDGKAVWSGC